MELTSLLTVERLLTETTKKQTVRKGPNHMETQHLKPLLKTVSCISNRPFHVSQKIQKTAWHLQKKV